MTEDDKTLRNIALMFALLAAIGVSCYAIAAFISPAA